MDMVASSELRALVAQGIRAINEEHGGRFLSSIARHVGVDRTTVTRWRDGLTVASVDHCRALARLYPHHFNESRLVELHAMAAVTAVPQGLPLMVGAEVLGSAAEVHGAAADALEAEPSTVADRTCHLAGLHLDYRGTDAVGDDPHMDDESVEAVVRFRSAMGRRAAEGWRIRSVQSAGNPSRIDGLRSLVESVEGPDIEIRAYPTSVPLVLSPLVIGNREVFLAYDHRRWERPHSALLLRSVPVVQWANGYFEQLFHDAPIVLRSVHGPRPEGFAELSAALGA